MCPRELKFVLACAKPAIGPFLGEWSGLAEHDRHGWELGLDLSESLGGDRASHMGVLEDLAVALFDDNRSARQAASSAIKNLIRPLIIDEIKSLAVLRSTAATTCRQAEPRSRRRPAVREPWSLAVHYGYFSPESIKISRTCP